jgi:chemotaxis protein MotB
MAAQNVQPIIIKKKKSDHGFHGGHWKVALADFMTSMFIIFLLLWLLNLLPPEVKQGLADYFSPSSTLTPNSPASGILGGQTITAPGSQVSISAPLGPPGGGPTSPEVGEGTTQTPGFPGTLPNARGLSGDTVGAGSGMDGRAGNIDGFRGPGTGIGPGPGPAQFPAGFPGPGGPGSPGQGGPGSGGSTNFAMIGDLALRLGAEVGMAIQRNPDLQGLQQNVIVEPAVEGVRIQLVDNDRREMFPRGNANPLPQTQALLAEVARIVAPLSERITVAGHTDSTPFPRGSAYTNWELSADRANAARRVLARNGIGDDRVAHVLGKADREPMFPDQPNAPQNRRLTITVMAPIQSGQAQVPALPTAGGAPPLNAPAPVAPVPAAAPRAVVQTAPGPAPSGPLIPVTR